MYVSHIIITNESLYVIVYIIGRLTHITMYSNGILPSEMVTYPRIVPFLGGRTLHYSKFKKT